MANADDVDDQDLVRNLVDNAAIPDPDSVGVIGPVFYSVGRDLKDEGGVPWNGEKKTGDMIFILRQPPLSRTR